jgi:restriction system protein
MSEFKMWGIHAGKLGQVDIMFFDKSMPCIAIGWDEMGDLSQIPAEREAFKAKYKKIFPSAKKGSIATSAGMLFRYLHEVQIGDYIVYPRRHSRTVHIGKITGEYQYNPARNSQYPNIRAVVWINEVPRTACSQGALYEMGSAMAFFQIRNYADELIALANNKKPIVTKDETDDTVSIVSNAIEESTRDFIQKRLSQIFKGHPFEHLAAHILEILGYKTRITPEGPDTGIDIVAYKDELGLEPPIIKVQVKSNDSDITPDKVQALYGNVQTSEYGLFIALNGFSKKAREFARTKSNLRLIDGEELIDLILTHYERLDSKYKAAIPLKNVYIPAQVEDEDD